MNPTEELSKELCKSVPVIMTVMKCSIPMWTHTSQHPLIAHILTPRATPTAITEQ